MSDDRTVRPAIPPAIPPAIDPAVVAGNLVGVRDRIVGAGGDPDQIVVQAVTKGFGADAVLAALAAGLTCVGESYAQELADKAPEVAAAPNSRVPNSRIPEWHFIGRLQSNKVRLVADVVSCWQSVDRRSLVDEIAKRSPGATILVQVNASGEPQKGGCLPADAGDLVARARAAGLVVDGCMTVGVDGDERATSAAFDQVRWVVDDLGLRVASMGMTADLELAVRAGSTMIRVGSALFGRRPRGRGVAVGD